MTATANGGGADGPTRADVFGSFPVLETSRLVLRQPCPDDLDGFFEIFSDPAVCQPSLSHPFSERAQALAILEDSARYWTERSRLTWAIVLRSRSSVIGKIVLHTFSFQSRRAELGFELGSGHWRRGYMSEALHAVLAFAFGVCRLHKIGAQAIFDNAPCHAMLERAGFRSEGLFREHMLWEGRYLDIRVFGLLASEFEP